MLRDTVDNRLSDKDAGFDVQAFVDTWNYHCIAREKAGFQKLLTSDIQVGLQEISTSREYILSTSRSKPHVRKEASATPVTAQELHLVPSTMQRGLPFIPNKSYIAPNERQYRVRAIKAYELLGVPVGASAEELAAAHKAKRAKHHPDKAKGNDERDKALQQDLATEEFLSFGVIRGVLLVGFKA